MGDSPADRASIRHDDAKRSYHEQGSGRVMTSPIVSQPRRIHILPEPVDLDIVDFAPFLRGPNGSAERQAETSGVSWSVMEEEKVEIQHCANDRFVSQELEKLMLTIMTSSARELSSDSANGAPNQDFVHRADPVLRQTIHSSDASDADKNGPSTCSDVYDALQNLATQREGVEHTEIGYGNDYMPVDGDKSEAEECSANPRGQEIPRNGCSAATPTKTFTSPTPTISQESDTSIQNLHSSLLRPQNANGRVTKSVRSATTARPQKANDKLVPPRGPTEEDLLLLLMRRQRVRDQAYHKLLADARQLQLENQQLKDKDADQVTQLESVANKWHEAIRESHVREADTKVFKDKYDKLKAWAREMHEEYAVVRAEGTRISDTLSELKAERQGQLEERTQLFEKIENAAQLVRKVKEIVNELRGTCTELETTRGLLRQAQEEVQQEKLQNKAYALHVERLEVSQRSMNFQFLKEQNEMRTDFAKMLSQLRKQDTTSLKHAMTELASVMNELRQKASSKREISAHFTSLIATAEQNYTSLSTAVASIGQIQAERDIVHELKNSLDQLKMSHAAELAEHSARARLEADQKLAIAHEKTNEVEEKYQVICAEKANLQDNLADLQSKFEAKGIELAKEKKRLCQLQGEEQGLAKRLKESEEILKGSREDSSKLERRRKKVEEERDVLSKKVAAGKAELKNLKEELGHSKIEVEQLRDQISSLEGFRESHKATTSQLKTALEDANKKSTRIYDLEKGVQRAVMDSEDLAKELEAAKASAQQLPGLQDLIQEREKELVQLRQDLTTCHVEINAVHSSLSKQEQLVQRLEEEKSNTRDELKKLASAHEHCASKQDEINNLKTTTRRYEEERTPLATLIELLTTEEKTALSKEVVLSLKDIIHGRSGKDCNNSEGSERRLTKPRRAANRDAHANAPSAVVQDSPNVEATVQDHHHHSDTSDLSELSDESDDIDNVELNAAAGVRPLPGTCLDSSLISRCTNTTRSEDVRPGTSNHEMLFRSSDVSNYPNFTQTPPSTVLVQASAPNFSPMRTRGGSQIRHGTPTPQTGADGERVVNFSTPPSYFRENHVPNSAVKRRQNFEDSEPAAKRTSISMKDLEIQPLRSSVASSSTQTLVTDSSQLLPLRAQTNTIGIAMPAPSKTKKRATNSTKKTAKSAKMQAQFNAPAV